MTARLPARAIALALLVCAAAPALAAPAPTPPPMRGFALGVYRKMGEPRPWDYAGELDELQRLGVTHVSMVVSWKQRDVRANTIAPDAQTTIPDAALRALLRGAARRGLKVLLFPILELEVRRPLEWRGTLKPTDLDAWWKAYARFVLHYAQIAADEGVAVYSVGSELVSTEAWRDRWYALISAVEKRYSGELLYSANWDHFEPVSFWERLDYVGVTAYHELTRAPDAPQVELAKAWAKPRDALIAFARRVKKPVVITEVGYTSQDGAAIHPWDYTSRAAIDLEEQRRCYAGFVEAWAGVPELHGVFFWNWFGAGGKTDGSYTPRGKPAEGVVRGWYGGGPRAPAAPGVW